MNSEVRRSRRGELYRLRRERETTEEREERLARQREYMRHRRARPTMLLALAMKLEWYRLKVKSIKS